MRNKDHVLLENAYKRIKEGNTNVPAYNLDPEDQDFFDLQNEYVSDSEFISNLDHKKIAPMIYKNGRKLFTISIDGIDPDVDGDESYYSVEDRQVLKNIASTVYNSDPEIYEQIATDIGTGKVHEFMIQLPRTGFTGEGFGEMRVYFVEPGGSEAVQKYISNQNR